MCIYIYIDYEYTYVCTCIHICIQLYFFPCGGVGVTKGFEIVQDHSFPASLENHMQRSLGINNFLAGMEKFHVSLLEKVCLQVL